MFFKSDEEFEFSLSELVKFDVSLKGVLDMISGSQKSALTFISSDRPVFSLFKLGSVISFPHKSKSVINHYNWLISCFNVVLDSKDNFIHEQFTK